MSMILLAVEDTDRDAPIRDLLTAEGWWVTTVTSREEAVRAAADHAPQLLIIDQRLTGDEASPGSFVRAGGGCSVLVLLDRLAARESAPEAADGWLGRDQKPEALVGVVRRSLERPRRASEEPSADPGAARSEEQLTARDLFGDILDDLSEVPDETPAAMDEVEAAIDRLRPIEDEEASAEAPAADIADPAEAVDAAVEFEPVIERLRPLDDEEASAEAPVVEVDDVGAKDAETEDAAVEGPPVEEVPLEDVSIEEVPIEDISIDEVPIEEVSIEEAARDESSIAQTPYEDAQSAGDGEADAEVGEDAGAPEAEPLTVDVSVEETGIAPSPISGVEGLAAAPQEGAFDDGEPTTDLLAEVADLLESGRSAWLANDEPDSGIALSIEEVLAVQEAFGEGEKDEKGEEATAEEEPEWLEEVDPSLERVGPYSLLELIEFGDLTERWLARRSDGRGGRLVLERVRRELRNRADVRAAFVEGYSEAAGWEHDSVLKILDLGRDGDTDFVATEYRPGHSLREVLERVRRMEARMPMGVSLLVVERLAAAFEVLAEGPANTRHGWLVPSSVWLADDGAVLLREFGFGRLPLGNDSLALDWSEHRFMAPERGASRGDLRSDLYSLGALLYEMMCGQPVHRAPDLDLLRDNVAEVQIVPSQLVDPTIPAEIDMWVMRLLRRDPGERPQSVSEVASKIDLALQALPARPAGAELSAYVRQVFAARVPRPVEPAVPEPAEEGLEDALEDGDAEEAPRRWRWWWWLLIALLVLFGVYLGWRSFGGDVAAALEPDVPSQEARVALPATPPAVSSDVAVQ